METGGTGGDRSRQATSSIQAGDGQWSGRKLTIIILGRENCFSQAVRHIWPCDRHLASLASSNEK